MQIKATPLAVLLQQGYEQVVAILLENDSKSKILLLVWVIQI